MINKDPIDNKLLINNDLMEDPIDNRVDLTNQMSNK